MVLHGQYHFVHGQLELLGGALDDADIGLVRDQPVDVLFLQTSLGQGGAGRRLQHPHRQLEDGLTVHLEHRVSQHLAASDMAGHTQNTHMAAIRMQVAGQNARLVAGLQHHSTSPVAKQHAGGAVVEIENARKDLCADDQGTSGIAPPNHGVSHGQRIHKAAAHGLHVKSSGPNDAAPTRLQLRQLVLNHAGGGGEHHVRCGSGHNDEINVLRLATSGFEGAARGLKTQVTAALVGCSEVTRLDTRAFDDPLG